ncbi:MAG: class I SAM-dependent methyltransferase [Candidatus Electrothrix sp. AW2]|nr:class I SAM-dependent methyltransferase [Candidatus Electrothrix gigas]
MKYDRDAGKVERDRDLFDAIALKYAAKDTYAPSRIARVLRAMQTLSKVNVDGHAHVLEVGCGAGFAAEHLCGHYAKYTGLDYSKELIKSAQQRNRNANVSFHATDFFDFTSEPLYDVVLMIGVLHHMSDLPAALLKSFTLLKPGGFLVVNEPQPANVIFQCLRHVRAKVDMSYSAEQEQLDATELLRLFSESGLFNVMCHPQGFFSTPFAEVMLRPQFLTHMISKAACALDSLLERHPTGVMKRIAWNIIVSGQKAS